MFHKELYKTVGAFALKGITYISIDIDKILIALNAKNAGVVYDKNKLRIISKPHAYLQTMTKTPVKFRKNGRRKLSRKCGCINEIDIFSSDRAKGFPLLIFEITNQ